MTASRPHSRLSRLLADCPLAITGVGAFSAAGEGVEVLWNAVAAGRSFARWEEAPPEMRGERIAVCRAPEIPADAPLVTRTDRCVRLGWKAATEALREANWEGGNDRIELIAGSSRGSLQRWEEGVRRAARARMTPSLALDGTLASPVGMLGDLLGLSSVGPMISATCASASYAIAAAAERLLLGETDAVLAGGMDASLHPLVMAQLEAAGVLGNHSDPALACRPFDLERNGLLLGEGAGFLVIETEEHARKRGVPVLAKLSSWATGRAAGGRAGIDPEGRVLQEVIRKALDLGALHPSDIGYVNAHGTGTRLNDAAEARAFAAVFGANQVPVSSTKPVTGHCLGATGALEAVIAVRALQAERPPAQVASLSPDPECPVRLADGGEPLPESHILSTSLGFWGYHGCIVISSGDRS